MAYSMSAKRRWRGYPKATYRYRPGPIRDRSLTIRAGMPAGDVRAYDDAARLLALTATDWYRLLVETWLLARWNGWEFSDALTYSVRIVKEGRGR